MIKQTKAALAEAKAELDRLSLLQCLAQRRYDNALEAHDRACLDAAVRLRAPRRSSGNAKFLRNRTLHTLLSRNEREAVRLKLQGRSLAQIERELGSGKRSAPTMLLRAREKFGLETNQQLMEFAKCTNLFADGWQHDH